MTYTFPNGLVLEVPEEILIIENHHKNKQLIPVGTHYVLQLGTTKGGSVCFNILSKNGLDYRKDGLLNGYLNLETLLDLKYQEFSLERYLNTRVFL